MFVFSIVKTLIGYILLVVLVEEFEYLYLFEVVYVCIVYLQHNHLSISCLFADSIEMEKKDDYIWGSLSYPCNVTIKLL